MPDITKRVLENKKPNSSYKHAGFRQRKPLSAVATTIILVSLFWLLVTVTVIGYIQHGHAAYDKGVFDGMSKTKAILQSK